MVVGAYVAEATYLMVDRRAPETRCNLQGYSSIDLIPLARAYLLKFSPPLKIVPPAVTT
jgi:hypothetical protein